MRRLINSLLTASRHEWFHCLAGNSLNHNRLIIVKACCLTSVTARVSIEAGVTQGWHRYVGSGGIAIGLDRFGASAPYEVIYEKLGITADAMVEAAKSLL